MKEIIKKYLIEAMKEKNKLVRDLLRYINSEIAKREKESGKELNDDAIIEIIKKEIKAIEDNVKIAVENNHEMDFFTEGQKAGFLCSLLPKQLSEEEVKLEVDKIFAENEFANMRAAMKVVIPKLGAIADKAMLSKLVKERF